MAWTLPKTDWSLRDGTSQRVTGDYFSAVDYNRIKNNIQELYNDAVLAGYSVTIADMGSDKTTSDMFYATDINTMLSNLNAINQASFQLDYYFDASYQPGQTIMTYVVLNEIESCCLELYTKFNRGQRKLPILLGTEGVF